MNFNFIEKLNKSQKIRFYLNRIVDLDKKIELIISTISLTKEDEKLYLFLKFWQEDTSIIDELKKNEINIIHHKKYLGDEEAGGLACEITLVNSDFIHQLLLCHFNYETGGEPYLNIRPYFVLNESKIIIDIYDDRGFDIYCR